MRIQANGMYAAECGDLVWYCEGHQGPVGKPEIRVGEGDKPDIIYEQGRGLVILNAYVLCTGCGRMAPEINGCRYVLKSDIEGDEIEEDKPPYNYFGMGYT